jgi:hypothetical protein
VLTFLSCAIPALVIEGKRGREALRRSWSLVRGRGWPVFGTIIVATILTMPYMALVGVFIYLDMRVRKEQYSAAELERDLATTAT